MNKKLIVTIIFLVFLGVAVTVQAAGPDPSRFEEVAGSGGSVLRDTHTGLEWQRCPYGQSWNGADCSGTVWKGTWDEAITLNASGGFRLPTYDELSAVSRYIEQLIAGKNWYWTSKDLNGLAYARSDFNRWDRHPKKSKHAVLLVR